MKKRKKIQVFFGVLILLCCVVPLMQSYAEEGKGKRVSQKKTGDEKVQEVYLTEEEYEVFKETEKGNADKAVNVTDEVSITYFPKKYAVFQMAARASDLVYSGKVNYHGYDVGIFTIKGKTAFCIQHSKWNPETGTAYRLEPWNNVMAKKILYYGYGGKKPWKKFENDVHARVLTSLALSNLVEGRFATDDYIWGTGKLEEFLQYCKGQKLPDTSLSLSKEKLQAYREGTEQRTEVVTLNAGDSSNTVVWKVPHNVTIHNVTKNTKVTGAAGGTKVTIAAGERFYFSAPISVSGTWESGEQRGTLQTITALNRVYCDGNNQDLCCAVFGVEQGDKVSLQVKWLSKGKVKIQKKSVHPTFSDGNSCYSLDGAKFAVYKKYDSNTDVCAEEVARFQTDAKGISNVVELDVGTYYVKELSAPAGFLLSTEVKKIEVMAGNEQTIEFADMPQWAPVTLLLKKVDAETQQSKPQGNGKLSEAEFSVEFYPGLWGEEENPKKMGETAARRWIFKTDRNGVVEYKDSYRVGGDELYRNEKGEASLPLGTVVIQETKAPEGYFLNEKTFVVQIIPKGDMENTTVYQPPVVSEEIMQLRLTKRQKGTDIVIAGVEFEHTKPDGSKEKKRTDKEGRLQFLGLQYGRHKLQETAVEDGYLLNPAVIEFEVKEDNRIVLLTQHSIEKDGIEIQLTERGLVEVLVEDETAPFKLRIHKENEKGKRLADAVFSIFSDPECEHLVKKGMTNAEGELCIPDLKVGEKYYMAETEAPKGYRIPLDKKGNPQVYEIWTESIPAEDKFLCYIDGKCYNSASEGMFTIGGTKAEREVHMTICNVTEKKLPDTGSNQMYPMLLIGIALEMFLLLKSDRVNRKK